MPKLKRDIILKAGGTDTSTLRLAQQHYKSNICTDFQNDCRKTVRVRDIKSFEN